MNNKRWLLLVSILLGSLPAIFSTAALAATFGDRWLEVRVQDRQDGHPLEGAAVCLGTSARPDQFGALRTDATGTVRFDEFLPDSMLLTVSRPGFQGRKQLLEPLYENRIVVVSIAHGGGGPQCNAPAAAKKAPAGGLVIQGIRVRPDSASTGGDHRVRVAVQLSGKANQIRISEQPDFADAKWQPLKGAVPYQLSDGKGLKTIYVQVRRMASAEGAAIEVASPVRKAHYRVR